MKNLLTCTAIVITATAFSQSKSELEAQVSELQNNVATLETQNTSLQNSLNESKDDYAKVLKERIEQEKEIASLTHSLDSTKQRLNSGGSSFDAQLIQFNNSTAKFSVPNGKTWEITNVFSAAVGPDAFGYNDGWAVYDEVRVFIKSINGDVLTDLSTWQLGPVIYRGPNHERTHALPIILPGGTEFELLICTGSWREKNDVLQAHPTLGAYLNVIEQ